VTIDPGFRKKEFILIEAKTFEEFYGVKTGDDVTVTWHDTSDPEDKGRIWFGRLT
jgi:hypothetical protein